MPPMDIVSSEVHFDMEFRSPTNTDSWYTVKLLLVGDTLRVNFAGFSDSDAAVFDAANFKSEAELDEFQGRFRILSVQLQDNECSKVEEGTLVCVSHTFGVNDLRFYDGVIEEVKHKEHTFAEGEEVCLCQFLLCWQHGPDVGKLSVKTVENICIVQSNVVETPSLTAFVEIVKKKLNKHGAKQSQRKVWPSDEIFRDVCERSRQDTDMGGKKKCYYILVQNVEKQLSPLTVSKFIHQQTSITCQVCILPSITWEPSTRAIIALDCEKNLEQLYSYLQDPNHIIISSTGRPWVVAEKISRTDGSLLTVNSSSNKLVDTAYWTRDELKVVSSGTEEFKKAEEIKNLFIEFTCYQVQLHKKLLIEEKYLERTS